jgi:2-polyprenyl-3-methyl-5-hydroxy-6-metoxy-1,4-benzoquinol methylase
MTDRTSDVAVQVRQLFDAKAATWPSKYAQDGRLAGRLTRMVDAVTYHVPAGGSVLDLGCGTGELASAIATAGLRVTGCDISPEMLHRAAAADPCGAVDWVQLDPDWQVLPFGPQTFDAVVASSVLEYVDDPTAVLRECCRLLRPGGVILCTVPDPHHPVRRLEWLLGLAGRMPVVRVAGRCWPRLDGYLAYLRVSRQRHSSRWWNAAGAGADLTSQPTSATRRAPLLLVTFSRPGDRRDRDITAVNGKDTRCTHT